MKKKAPSHSNKSPFVQRLFKKKKKTLACPFYFWQGMFLVRECLGLLIETAAGIVDQ